MNWLITLQIVVVVVAVIASFGAGIARAEGKVGRAYLSLASAMTSLILTVVIR